MNKPTELSEQLIMSKIYLFRGKKVMLDADLAQLYGVETKRLKEQVRRNMERFPEDFMFQLSENESSSLRSQNATSNVGRGGTRYLPMVFTEHGVLMLSSVLSSQQAVAVNIQIMRIFSKYREWLVTNQELLQKMEKIEEKFLSSDERFIQLEEEIRLVFITLKEMIGEKAETPQTRIGFRRKAEEN